MSEIVEAIMSTGGGLISKANKLYGARVQIEIAEEQVVEELVNAAADLSADALHFAIQDVEPLSPAFTALTRILYTEKGPINGSK